MAITATLLAGLFLTCPIIAQDEQTAFDVASVKRSGPLPSNAPPQPVGGTASGGPGSRDPGQITYSRTPLKYLIRSAYGVAFDQITGPDWLGTEPYTIVAKLRPETTQRQVGLMLRSLLEERFGLKYHWTKREFPVFELTVSDRGAKLARSNTDNVQPLQPGGTRPKAGRDGFPELPAGIHASAGAVVDGVLHETYRGYTIDELALAIGRELGSATGSGTWAPARILNRTNLTERYDFTLAYVTSGSIGGASAADLAAGPTIFEALQNQLGLRLLKSKSTYPVLVIDAVMKEPTPN